MSDAKEPDLVVTHNGVPYPFNIVLDGYQGLVPNQNYLAVFDAASDKPGYLRLKMYQPISEINDKSIWTDIGMLVAEVNGCSVITCLSNDGTTAVLRNMHTGTESTYVYTEQGVGDPVPKLLN